MDPQAALPFGDRLEAVHVRPTISYRLRVEINGLYDWAVRVGTQQIKLTATQKASMEAAIGKAILDPSPFSPLRRERTMGRGGFRRSEQNRFKAPRAPLLLSGYGFRDGRPTGYHLTAGSSIIWLTNRA
jgi:hypothetical protein